MCDPSLLVSPTSFYLRVVPSVVRQTFFQPKVMKDYQQKKLHAFYLKDGHPQKLAYPGDPKTGFMEPQKKPCGVARFGWLDSVPKNCPLARWDPWGEIWLNWSSWWFQPPVEKYARQIGAFPQVGVNIKNIWKHHLVYNS